MVRSPEQGGVQPGGRKVGSLVNWRVSSSLGSCSAKAYVTLTAPTFVTEMSKLNLKYSTIKCIPRGNTPACLQLSRDGEERTGA